ncbi:MAG: YcaO-like family protein, partial [Hyphomicrobiales bacterium]
MHRPEGNRAAFAAELKGYRHGTHRVVEPLRTQEALASKLALLGVTRVADVTGLDYIGIPVMMSVRPLSRTLSVNQGKGLTREEARTSAIMESVEYFCAERTQENLIRQPLDSFEPRQFVLPKRSLRRRLAPRTAIPWVPGRDLMSGRTVLVPEEVVRLDFSVPQPEHYGWFRSTSNGLAAGNTLAEASLHAICELVERDAFSLWLQAPARRQAEG